MSKETTREQAARVQATSRFRPSDFEDEDAWRFAYEEAISNFLAGCEHEAKRDKWVSVKERLPEEHELVVCSFCGIVSYGKWNGQVWVVNDEPESSLVKTDIISFVTHWQPLPNPPKGGE